MNASQSTANNLTAQGYWMPTIASNSRPHGTAPATTNNTNTQPPGLQQPTQAQASQPPPLFGRTTQSPFANTTQRSFSGGSTTAAPTPDNDKRSSPTAKAHDPRLGPARTFSACDSIVTVRVDDPPSDFNMHRSVLLRSSEFLKTKAKPEWSKGDAVVDLTHHSSAAFTIYSKWLYSDRVVSSRPRTPEKDEEWILLAQAFALGEELMDANFKDAVMDTLRAKVVNDANGNTFWTSAYDVVRTVYGGTPPNSKARSFLVDIFHAHADAKALDSEDAYPSDFLLDLARASLARRTKTPMTSPATGVLEKCGYHEHASEGKCYLQVNQ